MTCIAVVGTHRTGTSTVAGVLHYLGVNMGDNMKPAHPSNPKGHFEDMDFLLHDDKVVGDWRYPDLSISDDDLTIYRQFINQRKQYPIWGIKDPRLCVTLIWFYEFIDDLRVIATERNLIASSKSLKSVHPMKLEEAIEIQHDYLYARAKFLNVFDGPVITINYEDIIQFPEETCKTLKEFSGAPNDIWDAVEFVSPELKHY